MIDLNKPLFVPLRTEYFDKFEQGLKTTEYRLLGARWNANTCPPGRSVVLSHGYGINRRLHTVILRFEVCSGRQVPECDQADILSVFGRLDVDIACIHIDPLVLKVIARG